MKEARITCSLHTALHSHKWQRIVTQVPPIARITRITNIALTLTITLHSQVLPNITLTQIRTLHARRVLCVIRCPHICRRTYHTRRSYRSVILRNIQATTNTHTCPTPNTLSQMTRSHRSLSHTYHSYRRFLQCHRLEHRTHVKCHRDSVLRCHHTEYCSTIVSTVLYVTCVLHTPMSHVYVTGVCDWCMSYSVI